MRSRAGAIKAPAKQQSVQIMLVVVGKKIKNNFDFRIQLKIPFLVSVLHFLVWVTGPACAAEVPNHSGTLLLAGGCGFWKETKAQTWKEMHIDSLDHLHSSTPQIQAQLEP